jgi:hypothetical protein
MNKLGEKLRRNRYLNDELIKKIWQVYGSIKFFIINFDFLYVIFGSYLYFFAKIIYKDEF